MNNFNKLFLFFVLILKIILINSYTTHYNIKTILHYVDENNKFLFNNQINRTAWDRNWNIKIGVVSLEQCPHIKSIILPKENTFYCALPYNDLDQYGRKANAYSIPWSHYDDPEQKSILKNRWIKVIHKDAFVFCQYEDVGPEFDDDFSYVFGASHSVPESTYGGLAISPEVADFLGIKNRFKPIKRKMTTYDASPITPFYQGYDDHSFTTTPAQSSSPSPSLSNENQVNDSSSSTNNNNNNNTTDNNNNNNSSTTNTPNTSSPTSTPKPSETPTPSPTKTPSSQTLYNGNSAGGWIKDYWGDEGDDYSPFSSSSVIPITPEPTDDFKVDNDDVRCSWQFVDDNDVPDGPWKKIITTSPSDEVVKSFQNN